MTPVVVSSVPPRTLESCSGRSPCSTPTTSAPSSIVIWGRAIDDGVDVPVVGVVVLAVDRVDLGAVAVDQGRGHVVLGGERVRGAEHRLGAAGDQGAGQVGGLGRHVQAAGQGDPVERPLLLEALADRSQHGHVPVCPFDPSLPVVREADVGDVVALLGGCQTSPFRRDEVGRIGAHATRAFGGGYRERMDDPMPVNAEVAVPLSEVEIRTSRSSGPEASTPT